MGLNSTFEIAIWALAIGYRNFALEDVGQRCRSLKDISSVPKRNLFPK